MNSRLTLSAQGILTLLIGLFLGYAFQSDVEANVQMVETPAANTQVPAQSPAPFVTLSGGFLVRVRFFRDEAPEFVKIVYLDQARLTIFPQGDDRIDMLDSNGQVLYSESFLVEFLNGDPPHPVDSKTIIFVLPFIKNAVEIDITTSNGKVKYDIPSK